MRGRSGTSACASPSASSSTPARAAASSSPAITSRSTGSAAVCPSATTSRAALELGQEEDLVDQRAGVLDLDARLRDQPCDVRAGQIGGVEEREDPRERRPQLVRDGGGEAGAKLVEAAVCGVHVRHILAIRRVVLVTIHQIVTIPKPEPTGLRSTLETWPRS